MVLSILVFKIDLFNEYFKTVVKAQFANRRLN